MSSQNDTKSFTLASGGRLNVLATPIWVGSAFDHTKAAPPTLEEFIAIWDTGASSSVITQRVVDACDLKPVGMTKVHTANGEAVSEVYMVCIMCPNQQGFSTLRVTRGKLKGCDVLIGMDVIGSGDLAVTNKDGKTMMSYRWPSVAHIDFTGKATPENPPDKVGRNDPCPCGSGKKYKYCCGKPGT